MNKKNIVIDMKKNIKYRDILSCMRCGLCLNNCSTFKTFRTDEVNSPRGRVALMRSIIEGIVVPDEEMREAFDKCIVCRKCEEVCPSGVKYFKLINQTRNIFDKNK